MCSSLYLLWISITGKNIKHAVFYSLNEVDFFFPSVLMRNTSLNIRWFLIYLNNYLQNWHWLGLAKVYHPQDPCNRRWKMRHRTISVFWPALRKHIKIICFQSKEGDGFFQIKVYINHNYTKLKCYSKILVVALPLPFNQFMSWLKIIYLLLQPCHSHLRHFSSWLILVLLYSSGQDLPE